MTGRFEWHITLPSHARPVAQRIAEQYGWTFSEISGCPILGQGRYAYVTGFAKDSDVAYDDMRMVAKALKDAGAEVIRQKIENIVFDTKTNVNEVRRVLEPYEPKIDPAESQL